MLPIPGNRNVIKKEAGKILKSTDFVIEIYCTCNVKEKVIPIITGANGTISKSLRQYLSNIPGKREIKVLHKQPYLSLHTY
jgi:DNA polymerase III sliding clamp (beta) subunit (PCNA family)